MLCKGYKKDFKWRAFEETTLTTKPTPSSKIKTGGPFLRTTYEWRELMYRLGSTYTEVVTHRLGSPAASETFSSTASVGTAFPPSTYPLPDSSIHHSSAQLLPQPIQDGFNQLPADHSLYMSQPYLPLHESQPYRPSVSSSNTTNTVIKDECSLHASAIIRPTFTSGQSPRLIDLLLPGTDLRATNPEFKEYSIDHSKILYQPGDYSCAQDDRLTPLDEDVEDIVRQQEPDEAWGLALPSPSPSNSSTSTEGFSLNSPTFMSRQPQLHPGSPEMLMIRFDQQTCGILSVKDGPTENPWRTMMWPLARDSPALYHAISSMTAFHSSKEQPGLRVVGMEHMRRSVRYLAEGLKTMRTETALATTLVLAFAESWDQHISSGTEHLRGARILLNQALTRHKRHALNVMDFGRLQFLCNTWIYMDVIARLTCIDDDDSDCFDAVLANTHGPLIPYQNIDPLMGCASTLFPLIGRAANLIRKVRTSSTNSINVISQANELKAALENWQAPSAFEVPEDPTSEIQHSLQTAEAYRWATLLYLHQAVPEIPFKSAAQLAEKVLVYLATVPLTSRTIIVQIYPLLAAGCEASSAEDRKWVKDRWAAMMSRMLIGNLDRCWEVIQEVWNRRDADDAEKIQARRSRDAFQMQLGSGLPEMTNRKRKFNSEHDLLKSEDSDDEVPWGKRRATQETTSLDSEMGRVEYLPRNISIDMLEEIDFEKTVRGRLHWIGVMKDWKWEGRGARTCDPPRANSRHQFFLDEGPQSSFNMTGGVFTVGQGEGQMMGHYGRCRWLPRGCDG